MDRRVFLLSGSAATAAASSGLLKWGEGEPEPAAPPTASSAAKVAAQAEQVRVAIQAATAVDTAFQLAFVPHAHQRGTMARQIYEAPLRVTFYGFGFRAATSPLQALTVDAGYLASDASAQRHMMWAYSKRGTSSPVNLSIMRGNFAGFLADATMTGAKARGIETYAPGGEVPWEYGSYVLATRSHTTDRFPEWSQFTYSGNPAQPLAFVGSGLGVIDFDYLTFEVTRDQA